jgi:membrane protease YdiL (CAAX protease family)
MYPRQWVVPPPPTPEELERKEIRRAGNLLGWGLLALTLISVAFSLVIGLVVVINEDFGVWINGVLNDAFGQLAFNVALTVPVFTIPFYFAVRTLQKDGRQGILLYGKPKTQALAPVLCVALGLCMLGNFATDILYQILNTVHLPPYAPELSVPPGWEGKVFFAISVAVCPALVEEFAFRGAILGALRKHGDLPAIFISAMFFAAMHGNMVQAPFAFIVGIGLGWAVCVTESVWTGVIIHFINNFMSCQFSYLEGYVDDNRLYIYMTVYAIALLSLGIIGLVISAPDHDFLKLRRGTELLSDKQKIGAFLKAPAVVVASILFSLTLFFSLFYAPLQELMNSLTEYSNSLY